MFSAFSLLPSALQAGFFISLPVWGRGAITTRLLVPRPLNLYLHNRHSPDR